MNDHLGTSSGEDEATHLEQTQAHRMRRKLVRNVAAAPVLLVAGRSALACLPDRDKCGLSPMAWASIHPNRNGTVAISHEVGCNALGKSPGLWTPNKSGRTFQLSWPTGVIPFSKLVWHYLKDGVEKTRSVEWRPNLSSYYSGLPFDDPLRPGTDAGWNSGSKLPFGSDPRSISRILIEESARDGILWHICAAYLNAKRFPGAFAMTPEEVAFLHDNRRLVPGGRELSDSEIKSFLDQTWS